MELSLFFVIALLFSQVLSQDEDEWNRDFEDSIFARERVSRDQPAEGCYGKVADVFFILDSSTSIYINDYRQELQFARDIVSRFDIDQRNTRVGLLTFSDDFTRPPLELNRYQSKNELLSNINEQNLPYRTGVTNTDLAIRYVRENRFFRDNILKVIVVVTDGGSRSPWLTTREAELAREQGFYIFVIGVGQYQDVREWNSLASEPASTFVINVTNTRNLDQIKAILPPRICSLPPLDILRRCNIERSTDLFFVAAPGGVNDAFQVVERVVNATTDVGNYVRVSYVLSNCDNADNLPLTNPNSYCDRTQNLPPANPDTYVQLLQRVRAIARQQQRRNARQVAVLFIDEESLRLNRFGLASEIRNVGPVDNIDIIVVDLGVRIGNYVQNFAPSREDLFTFLNSASILSQRNVINALIDRTCTVINGEQYYTFGYTSQ